MSGRVLLTCPAGPVGPAVARHLGERGCAVVLDAARAADDVAGLAGPRCWPAPPGLGGADLVAFARDHCGGLDAVIHGDAGLDEGALLEAAALAQGVAAVFTAIHEVNRAAVVEMARERAGSVVFLLVAGPGGTGPVMQAGKLALMRSLAAELRPLGLVSAALYLSGGAPDAGARPPRRAPRLPPLARQAALLDVVLSPALGPLVSGRCLGVGGADDPEAGPPGQGFPAPCP